MENRSPQQPRAFGTSRAAALLDMSPDILRYRIRRGQVRAVRIGERLFVPATELDRLLELQRESVTQ